MRQRFCTFWVTKFPFHKQRSLWTQGQSLTAVSTLHVVTLVGSGHSQVPILGHIGFTFVGPGSQPTTHFGCHWFLTWEYISTLSLLWAWDHQLNPEFLLENLLMVPRSGLRGEAGATQAAYVFVILSKTCIIIFQK